MIRILLADDHRMFREGLRTLLECESTGLQVVGEASDGHEALRLARELHPDVVVLDFSMPLLNGLEAAREIHRCEPQTRTILLTMYQDDAYVLEAIREGIRGYVMKAQVSVDLLTAINEVMRGMVYLSPGISATLINAYVNKSDQPIDPLTSRERQVLQLIAESNSTKAIARILGLSPKTAESHRSRLMKKLDIHETAGLVCYAIRRGVVKL